MVSADYLYKFRSKISKNIYNDLSSTSGDIINSIYKDLQEKVVKIEFRMQESCIKIEMCEKPDTKEFTNINNIVDSNLRSFISLNRDKLELNSEEKTIFEEFINEYSLYEVFTIGKQVQFVL
jgi:hypothetical protein